MKLAPLEPVPQDFQMIPMFAVSQASCRWAESRIEGATVVLSNARSATHVRQRTLCQTHASACG